MKPTKPVPNSPSPLSFKPDTSEHDLGMMGFSPVIPWNLPNVRY